MTQTIIHVLRHGEVENPEGILYGRLKGYSLSTLGKKMAQMVADEFKKRPEIQISRIIASPLLRTQQTAKPISKAYNVPIETDIRLIEAGNHFEGIAVNKNPKLLASPKYWKYFHNPIRPSWGEPYIDIADRMLKVVKETQKNNAGQEILLVSHQLPIWCLRKYLEKKPLAHLPWQRECSLASVTTLIFENNTLVGIKYWEPAAVLLNEAKDVTPGTSSAMTNRG
ncbi:histidine phosphatase family protein [Actinomyces sp. zg-332]|uniref:histidine phosphatase family protein n=1 Tax=Actinomyces sp. zg-332 TaxID=2708340 RepID=UPI00141F2F7C|nr:histidine phosphatase family protein [Actinomyces sp. zg-332]QPK94041.1 histidine phosphatase family protein [Actinomyces sp. zg-332]